MATGGELGRSTFENSRPGTWPEKSCRREDRHRQRCSKGGAAAARVLPRAGRSRAGDEVVVV